MSEMSEIFDKNAYNEGAEKAKKLSEQIKGYITTMPAGFRAEVRGDQLFISAPHNLNTNISAWSRGQDSSGRSCSYVWLSQLTKETWDLFVTTIAGEIAKLERNLGFEQTLRAEFANVQKTEEKPQEPTKLEKQEMSEEEKRMQKVETEIATHIEGLELARKFGLEKQIAKRTNLLELFRHNKKVLEAGYEEEEFDQDSMSAHALEEYNGTIPLNALKELDEAKEHDLFSDFRVWVEEDDPILVGRVIVGEYKNSFKIAKW